MPSGNIDRGDGIGKSTLWIEGESGFNQAFTECLGNRGMAFKDIFIGQYLIDLLCEAHGGH